LSGIVTKIPPNASFAGLMLDLSSSTPRYRQLYEGLRDAILATALRQRGSDSRSPHPLT